VGDVGLVGYFEIGGFRFCDDWWKKQFGLMSDEHF
jgi:hypothetical protein